MKTFLVADTETSGLPKNYKESPSNVDNWPRVIQVAWALYDEMGKEIKAYSTLVKPGGFVIPESASKVHGITTEKATAEGRLIEGVLVDLQVEINNCSVLLGHNLGFDRNVLDSEMFRINREYVKVKAKVVDTMFRSVDFCKLPGKFGYKWPKLNELHVVLFNEEISGAHDALVDVRATARCFFELVRLGVINV